MLALGDNVALALCAAGVLFIVPGLLLNLCSGARLLWAAAGAIPSTFAVLGMGGWVLSQLGIAFLPGVWGFYALFLLLALAWNVLFRRRTNPAPVFAGITGYRWALPLFGVLVGTAMFAQQVTRLFDAYPTKANAITQGWDVHWHASEVRYILESGIADPTRMGELRNLETQAQLYYPSAWHAGAAWLADLLGLSPIMATNITGVGLALYCLPLSMALLAWVIVGDRGLVAQGSAALAAIAIYACPVVFWIGLYVGAWPYLAAMCMVGIVAACFMSLPTHPNQAFMAGLGIMGLIMVHPAPVTVVVFLVGCWWLLRVVSFKQRMKQLLVLATTGIVSALLLLPQLLSGSEATEEVKSFTAEENVTRLQSWMRIMTMDTRHAIEFGDVSWIPLFLAVGIGVLAVLWRRNLWILAVWALSALIAVNSLRAFASPWGSVFDVVGSLHYSTAHRLVMPVAMITFALAAVGVAQILRLLSMLVRQLQVSAAVFVVLTVAAGGLLVPWARATASTGSQWSMNSQFQDTRMVNAADVRAFDWLASQPKAYEGTIMGEPADGFGWMYAYNGLPSIARHYLWPTTPADSDTGYAYWHPHLIGAGNNNDPNQRNDVDDAIDALDINYYFLSPGNFWEFQEPNEALLKKIFTAPGLTLIYRDQQVSIFAVNAHFSDAELTAMRRAGSPEKLPAQPTYGQLGINLNVDNGDPSANYRGKDPNSVPYYHRSMEANAGEPKS